MHSPPRATPIISTHRRLPHSPSPRFRHPRQLHTTTDVIIIITPSPSPLPSPRTATTAAPGCYSMTTTTTIILKGPKKGAVGFIKAPQRVLLVVKTSQKGAFGDALVEGMHLDLEMALRVRLVSWSAPSGAFGLSQHQGGYCPGVLGGDTGNGSTYSLDKGPCVLGGDTCDGYIYKFTSQLHEL
ncbi:hypothetical protein Tco_1315551 [Tanacetum coccineum]